MANHHEAYQLQQSDHYDFTSLWRSHCNLTPNLSVSDGSQPPLVFDLSQAERAGSGSLHRRVRRPFSMTAPAPAIQANLHQEYLRGNRSLWRQCASISNLEVSLLDRLGAPLRPH